MKTVALTSANDLLQCRPTETAKQQTTATILHDCAVSLMALGERSAAGDEEARTALRLLSAHAKQVEYAMKEITIAAKFKALADLGMDISRIAIKKT